MVQISIALQHYYTVRGISRPQYWSGQPFPSPGDLPDPGIEPRSPTLQVDSLPAEPQGKPKNTGVGSLSLLQQIFPTQGLNQGPLHCKWILYHLSHQRSPSGKETTCQCRRLKRCGFDPWLGKIPWRRKWQPTPVSLPGESHGQRILAGSSP